MFWDHFFEHQLWLFCMGCCCQIIGMMYCANNQFLFHLHCEDGVAFLKFFIPTVVRVSIGENKLFPHAVAAAEDNRAAFPVYARVVALEPIVSEVNVFLSKVRYGEVNTLPVFPDYHREFHELGDIPALGCRFRWRYRPEWELALSSCRGCASRRTPD